MSTRVEAINATVTVKIVKDDGNDNSVERLDFRKNDGEWEFFPNSSTGHYTEAEIKNVLSIVRKLNRGEPL